MPNPMMNAGAMAGGGMPPAPGGQPPAGGQPTGAPPMVSPDNAATTDIGKIEEILKQILPQCVDKSGYVDMNRLITLWPQFSQVPFETVMQLIEQSPQLLDSLITQFGLAGINVNGKLISADELDSLGSGGSSGGSIAG